MKGLVMPMENIEEKERSDVKASADMDIQTPEGAAAQQTGADFVFTEIMPKKRRRKGRIIAAVVILVLAALLFLPRFLVKQPAMMTAGAAFTPHTVARGDITVTLSGSGTLQPADSYAVTSLVAGDILTAPFEEGDIVSEGQVLYTIDSTDVDAGIRQAQINLNNSQNQYNSALKQLEDLKLKAGGSGVVVSLDVEVGDMVTAGQTIATIQDSTGMKLTVPFQKDIAQSFYVGQSATVTLESTNESYSAAITEIGTIDQVLTGNVIARLVTVKVENPGVFTPSQTAYVTINGLLGLKNGTFSYGYQETVVSAASGKVAQLNVKVGSQVSAGQVIAVLQNDSVNLQVKNAKNALENAKISLESQKNKITSYTIKSPISGTIVEKAYKAGDKINMQNSDVLCTIFDLSYLTLTLNIDELDIGKVQPGQKVIVTAGAVQGEEYTGTVTKINIKGTTKNGVTSYPVDIRIDETEGLLPGMNVDAKIIVSQLKNVLTVPSGAVMRNNLVLLKTDETTDKPSGQGVPPGYSYVEVKLGPSNETSVVIEEGLKEGDIVAVMDNTPSTYDYFGMFGEIRAVEGNGEAPPPDEPVS